MMQFPIQNNQNPIDKGVNRSFDWYSKLLNALAMPEILKTQQETARADLEGKQLQNKYYPQATEADINYKGAQTAESRERTKEMPDELTVKEQAQFLDALRLQQSRDRFTSTIGVLSRFLSTDIGKAQYANDPEFANSASNIMRGVATNTDMDLINARIPGANSGQNLPPSSGFNQNLIPNFLKLIGIQSPNNDQPSNNMAGLFPYSPIPQQSSSQAQQSPNNGMTLSTPQVQALQNSPAAQQLGVSNGLQTATPNMQITPITSDNPHLAPAIDTMNKNLQNPNLHPEQVKDIQKTVRDTLEKKSTTTATLNQRQTAGLYNGLLQRAEKFLPAIYNYSGIMGHGKLLKDKVLAAAGIYTNPLLKDYISFEEVEKPGMANELRRKMGSQATDQEIKQMLNVVDPSTQWFYNKELSQAKIKELKENSYIIDKQLAKGLSETKQELVQEQAPTEDTQVMQGAGINIPTKVETRTDAAGRIQVRLPGKPWKYQDEL